MFFYHFHQMNASLTNYLTKKIVLIRDGRYLIACDILVKIIPTIRISLPAIITIKSSCWHIYVCDIMEGRRETEEEFIAKWGA